MRGSGRLAKVHVIMRKFTFLLLVLLLGLAGCAMDATVRSATAELPGTYYSGDGLGLNVTVVLKPDGTYVSDWWGCLGGYDQSSGTWTARAERIIFSPADENDPRAGYLTQATTIQYAGRLGFARDQDVNGNRISEQLVFFRESATP